MESCHLPLKRAMFPVQRPDRFSNFDECFWIFGQANGLHPGFVALHL